MCHLFIFILYPEGSKWKLFFYFAHAAQYFAHLLCNGAAFATPGHALIHYSWESSTASESSSSGYSSSSSLFSSIGISYSCVSLFSHHDILHRFWYAAGKVRKRQKPRDDFRHHRAYVRYLYFVFFGSDFVLKRCLKARILHMSCINISKILK